MIIRGGDFCHTKSCLLFGLAARGREKSVNPLDTRITILRSRLR